MVGFHDCNSGMTINMELGYNKASPPDSVVGFIGPTVLGGAINAPLDNGKNTCLGYKYFPFSQSQGYDPSTCASACKAQTAYNSRHPKADGSYEICVSQSVLRSEYKSNPSGSYSLTPISCLRTRFLKACTVRSTARRGRQTTQPTMAKTAAVTDSLSLEATATFWRPRPMT